MPRRSSSRSARPTRFCATPKNAGATMRSVQTGARDRISLRRRGGRTSILNFIRRPAKARAAVSVSKGSTSAASATFSRRFSAADARDSTRAAASEAPRPRRVGRCAGRITRPTSSFRSKTPIEGPRGASPSRWPSRIRTAGSTAARKPMRWRSLPERPTAPRSASPAREAAAWGAGRPATFTCASISPPIRSSE